jgi:cobalt-zinc-cadmium efflux system outer membrane protein
MRKTVRIVCLLALGVGLAPAPAPAQGSAIPRELALDTALRLAWDRNPLLHAAASAVEASEGDRLEASQRPNPAMTFESEGVPLFESTRPPWFDGQELTLRLDQEIETAGRRRLRAELADAGVAIARARWEDEWRRVALEVRRSYFAAVLAKADLAVAQVTLDEIDRVISVNRARLEQGEISGVDVRRLQVERLRFVDDVFAAQLALRNAKSALLALLNAPDLALDFDVTEPLAPLPGRGRAPTSEPALAQAMAVRPDLAALRLELEQADTETRLQRARRTPNVTVGGGYTRVLGANAVVFGVTVPLQIFNRNQGGVARAEAEGRRAAQLTDAAATRVRLDVQQALNALDVSAARVDYIEREYLGNAEQTRDTVLASYRLGAADLIDLLDSQRGFRDTVRTYNRALYEYQLSVFQLDAATGAAPGQPEEQ